MDKADKERLCNRLEEEDDLTDQEMREIYRSEITEDAAYESWKNGGH